MYQFIVLFYVLPCVGAAAMVVRDVLAPCPVWRAGHLAWLLAGTAAWLWLFWGHPVPPWGQWVLHLLHWPQDPVAPAPAAVLAAPVALVVTLLARSYHSG